MVEDEVKSDAAKKKSPLKKIDSKLLTIIIWN